MNPRAIARLPFSASTTWDEVRRDPRPSIAALVTFIVLPLSLIPPIMLYFAGVTYGDDLAPGFGDKEWRFITTIFFLAELLTFAVMGWLIYEVGNTRGARITVHDAYLIAAIAPIPLWLSAFGLFIPSLAINALISLAALGLACRIAYHGLRSLCRIREEVEVQWITYIVMAACVMAWGLLLGTIWAF